jgi:glycosyltransferase involved in cell wall biosynthesis
MLSKDRQEHWDLVYNFVDTEHFTPKKEAKKKKGKEMTILYPRFFNTSRGIDIAVKTAEAVCGRNKNIKFIFSGCHYDWEPHFASVLELQKKFPGQVEITTTDFEGMKVLYDRSDVVIIPTHCSEGSSLSCLEALSMGKIVLTSWAGGLPDIMLNRYNGFILPDRAERFIEKIEEVYEIKDTATITKMRQNARETAMAFDIEHWREHWYKTMKRMLGV